MNELEHGEIIECRYIRDIIIVKPGLNDESFCYAFDDLISFYQSWKDGGCKEFAGKQVRKYLKNLAEGV